MQTPQKKRLESLEATNARLAEQVAHLEAEAATSSAALKERAEQVASAAGRAAAADAEVARLQAEVESHEKQIALLEVHLLLEGPYSIAASARGLQLTGALAEIMHLLDEVHRDCAVLRGHDGCEGGGTCARAAAKTKAQMQARVGRGEYNPANTRVLHFVHNPEADARREHEVARISELEAESATLRAQLQALQPKEAGAEPESMAAAVAAAEKNVLEYKVGNFTLMHTPTKGVCAHGLGEGNVSSASEIARCSTFTPAFKM